MSKFIILLILIAFNSSAYTVYNDEDYYIYKTSNTSYILSESDFKHLPRLLLKTAQSIEINQKEFNWILDERLSIIVTSNRNQIANAFATTIPNNMSVFYKGGIEFLDRSASASWIDTLTSHEITHVYQLNVKNRLGSSLKHIFGNQPYVSIPLVPLPIFISPTVMLPTFLIEGNAVLNESNRSQGGRLFSGDYLVIATELVNSGQADLRFVMNSHLNFPFGVEKYILGGFFQSSLANTYQFSTINSFFKNHSDNNINPFDLKSTFAATFFADYEDLYSKFLYDFKEKQKDYKPYSGEHLTASLQNFEFKRIEDSIYFITVPDAKSPNLLNQFNISKKELTSNPTDLKLGKVFKLADKITTASSYSSNNRNIFYTLVDSEHNYIENYVNKFVTDIEGDFVSYFDMNDSFDRGTLYRNADKIAETESKALLDSTGNIYYFKQEGKEKVLYKNWDRLTSVENNFAVLADVISEDEIYFVSNTKNGSSLFCYCSKQLERVLPFDNIVSAVKAGAGFLASFQFSDSYRVAYVLGQDLEFEPPVTARSQLPEKYFNLVEAITPISIDINPEPYLSVKELRFSSYTFNLVTDKNHKTIINSVNWIDPLFFSDLNAIFSISDKLAYNSLGFQYSPYSTQFSLRATNETDFYRNATRKITSNSFQVAARNTLYQKKYNTVSLGIDYYSESNELFKNERATAHLSFQFLEQYFLNYLPYNYFAFTPWLEKSLRKTSQSYQFSMAKMLLEDFYVSANFSKVDSEYFKLEADFGQRNFFQRGSFIPVYYSSLYTSKLTQGNLEFIFEIPYSKYFYRFPVSLRRIAPFIGFQKNHSEELFLDTDIDEISFASAGIETELLLFHLNPMRIRLFSTEIVIQDSSESTFQIQVRSQF